MDPHGKTLTLRRRKTRAEVTLLKKAQAYPPTGLAGPEDECLAKAVPGRPQLDVQALESRKLRNPRRPGLAGLRGGQSEAP